MYLYSVSSTAERTRKDRIELEKNSQDLDSETVNSGMSELNRKIREASGSDSSAI